MAPNNWAPGSPKDTFNFNKLMQFSLSLRLVGLSLRVEFLSYEFATLFYLIEVFIVGYFGDNEVLFIDLKASSTVLIYFLEEEQFVVLMLTA